MSSMSIVFNHIGLTFCAEADYEPYVPAHISGPPENCYPAEGGFAEITALSVDGKDAVFLLYSDLADDLHGAAYDACVEKIESARQESAADRAADRAYDRRHP